MANLRITSLWCVLMDKLLHLWPTSLQCCHIAFDIAETLLATASVLTAPNFSRPFVFYKDKSAGFLFYAVKGMFPYILLSPWPVIPTSPLFFGGCVFYSHRYLLDTEGPVCFGSFCDFYTPNMRPSGFAFWGNVTIILGYLAEKKLGFAWISRSMNEFYCWCWCDVIQWQMSSGGLQMWNRRMTAWKTSNFLHYLFLFWGTSVCMSSTRHLPYLPYYIWMQR